MCWYLKYFVAFPSMWQVCRDFILTCGGCVQKHKYHQNKRMSGAYYPRTRSHINYSCHIDLAGPLPSSGGEGFKYILAIVDGFSGYLVTIPLQNKTHKLVTKGFRDHWINRFGTPQVIVSDNEFTSNLFDQMCQGLAVDHQAIPAYNPRSNAHVERRFGTMKRLLRACC